HWARAKLVDVCPDEPALGADSVVAALVGRKVLTTRPLFQFYKLSNSARSRLGGCGGNNHHGRRDGAQHAGGSGSQENATRGSQPGRTENDQFAAKPRQLIDGIFYGPAGRNNG